MRNRILNRSGASMLFVLAAMLLLMAIGASALAAATANKGASVKQQIENQLDLYADSMQRTIMSEMTGTDETDLKREILTHACKLSAGTASFSFNFTPTVSDAEYDITISDGGAWSSLFARVEDFKRYVAQEGENRVIGYEEDDTEITQWFVTVEESDRVPHKVWIDGYITVTMKVTYSERSIISVTTYSVSGAYFEDDLARTSTASPSLSDMNLENYGDWKFVSYEKIDLQ